MKELKHIEDLSTREIIILKQIWKRCDEVCVCMWTTLIWLRTGKSYKSL